MLLHRRRTILRLLLVLPLAAATVFVALENSPGGHDAAQHQGPSLGDGMIAPTPGVPPSVFGMKRAVPYAADRLVFLVAPRFDCRFSSRSEAMPELTRPAYLRIFLPATPQSHRAPPA